MNPQGSLVLVVGATGSIGVHVVGQALAQGYTVRAVVRDPDRARRQLPAGTELVVRDLTDASSLRDAVADIDAVVFTHGSNGGRPTPRPSTTAQSETSSPRFTDEPFGSP